MPKTHRQLIQRKLAQAYINISYSGNYLKELSEEFRPLHPELADILDNAMTGLAIVSDVIEKFGMKISGAPNINWYSWSGTNRPTHNDTEDEITSKDYLYAPEPDLNETDKGTEDGE